MKSKFEIQMTDFFVQQTLIQFSEYQSTHLEVSLMKILPFGIYIDLLLNVYSVGNILSKISLILKIIINNMWSRQKAEFFCPELMIPVVGCLMQGHRQLKALTCQ